MATVAAKPAPKKTSAKPAAKPAGKPAPKAAKKPAATLSLSSKNYSSWSLRGWLLAKFAGLDFEEVMVPPDDADARKELLLLAPSIRVPCLTHEGAKVWNTLAIAQYLDEIKPDAGLMPSDRIARAHCRSVSGEMNSGFSNLRSSLPMNLKARHPGYKIWAGAQPDIDRIVEIWTECLATYGGPFLFGKQRTMADAMYAPVCTRFLTYDVKLPKSCIVYCQTIMAMPEMKEWVAAAKAEPDDIEELDMDF
ncbi:glutathione S-transferase family protein [Piscinibacter gummiphilus]|uniref:Glutathione S-transferase family protein n=1 Tax=Piscinibacter gummiphilus TaxID=946333 RepID=A0ABZ0D5Y0_9BURK|nr:glutathione S-transferase family protein [Piscinibacter gummiphilus]WOB10453.1 glutathione S-transferase family protein [Piscinibacter gummiphilus]